MIIDNDVANTVIANPEVDLSRYNSISESAAQILAKSGIFHMLRLQINGLVGLLGSPSSLLSVNEVDSIHDNRILELSGVTEISSRSAAALCKQRRSRWICINLNKLETLDVESASSFSGHQGLLSLDGLKEISPEEAEELSSHAGYLSLDGIRRLGKATSRHLGSYKGNWLSLNGLREISDQCANELIRYDRSLLRGAKDIYNLPHEIYDLFTGYIRLNGLTQLSEASSIALSRNYSGLELNGLETLTREKASNLAMHKGGLLSLNGVQEISVEVAEALSSHGGALHLNGLKNLPEDIAEHLANYRGSELSLNGIVSISTSCAQKMARFRGWDLLLNELEDLPPRTASILRKTNASRIHLGGQTFTGNRMK